MSFPKPIAVRVEIYTFVEKQQAKLRVFPVFTKQSKCTA